MFGVTLKVLVFRYAYMMRQRWLVTISYLLFPWVMCFLPVYDSEFIGYETYVSHIEEHDELSLLRIPKDPNCTSSDEEDDCLLEILVCPGGAKERELMEEVESLLRHPDNTAALEITYVDDAESLDNKLVSSDSGYSRGLHFVEISSAKFEYKIRPRAIPPLAVLYDWADGYATTQRFPSPMLRGPRLSDPYFDVNDEILFEPGLLPLQAAVDKAYVNTYFPDVSREWSLTSFPHPPYKERPPIFRKFASHRLFLIYVQYVVMVGISFMISVFASYTISDKMSGIREWLCVNGAVRWMVNSSWLFSFCFEATILSVLEVGLLRTPTRHNGPTIGYMSSSVLFFVLVIYNWQSLCWVYLFANVFQSQILCVLIITAYWLSSPILHWIPPDRFTMQGFLAALPNAGLVLIFKSFQEFDGAESVLDLDRLYTYPIHYLPVGILLLIMLASSVFLVILGVYVDLVSPGPYGRARPWYLFQTKDKTENDAGHDESTGNERYFEEISREDRIALECVGISKSFRARKIFSCRFHKAVSNVNMQILKSKITVLLGPNGAGKTTLFSMLCGMYSPSAGHFYTEDYDVFQGDNIKKFRKVLGYCPQHNLLMNDLTVRQHLIIFGLLKGLSKSEAKKSCSDWIEIFDMKKFENTKVKTLSGGTKRKLCVAIAMTGNPLYLLLDEPSAGLDVKSCRVFWNILLEEKRYCTVILTTHDMNEAEILGDRVALLMNGQLVGYGSSSFLKKQLEVGYKIDCTVNEKDRIKFLRFVQDFGRSVSVLFETHNTVSLGVSQYKVKVIPNLLKSMESEFGDRISTSISCVTMDDVFVQFREGSKAANSQTIADDLEIKEDKIDRSCGCGQIKEMFKKKFEWLCNQSLATAIILLLIFPMLGIGSALYFSNRMIDLGNSSSADLKLAMDAYSGKMAFITKRDDNISASLKRAMNTSGIRYEEVSDDMVEFLNNLAKKDLFEYRSQLVFAFDSGDKEISTAYYSRNAFHTAPIAYSALINAILQGKSSITTHNFPFVEDTLRTTCLRVLPYIVAFLFLILLGPMLLFSASYFIIFPHIERRALFKHMQLMTGLLPWVYWISNLMFDMLLFSVSILLMILILAAGDTGLFFSKPVMLAFIVVLLLYGISIITFAYACSFCRCSTAMVVIWFISIPPLLFLLGYLLPVISIRLSNTISIKKLLYFLPWVMLMESLWKILTWAVQMRACYQCKDPLACSAISTQPLIGWLRGELTGFVIISLVYFTFIVAMDHGFGRKLKAMYNVTCHGPVEDDEDDVNPDVAKERQRVKNIEKEEDLPALICDGLGKKYSAKVTAVRDVTFALNRGNIFGLLGANGSGKSTTLGMLSGLVGPTKGSVIVGGRWDLSDCEYKYIRNVAFCPQFSGLLPGLSGRNTLRLFAFLRGVKSSKLRNSHVNSWIEALDMESLADRPTEHYSTGNKRKLNFAIAMIGSPTVVLLDEPTAGIDPVVRKRIWGVLSRRDSNQAIVLTSHTMSECEAICDGITIMVNGTMKCLGSVQELKSNFSKSSTLHVRLQNNATTKQADDILHNILKRSQLSRFAELEEKQTNLLKINVKTDKIKVYDVFAEMLKIKDDNPAIENFSLTETPLEEIFMTYAPSSHPKKRPMKTPH